MPLKDCYRRYHLLEKLLLGRGAGQVVSVLNFYCNDLSSNPRWSLDFFVKVAWKERK